MASTSKADMSSKTLPVHETDTNILFEKFTIDEIRGIEKKTRTDIERKKEDLRTMVGERYRDLIEAADTITEMKNSAQNVMKSIARIDKMCKELNQSHMVRGTSFHNRSNKELDQQRKQELKFHSIAMQIKLLLDMPEKIWSALDRNDYLTATRHYLLSRHIHTSLQLDSQQSPDLLHRFPVLNRQWAAISHFRATILQGSRSMLKESAITDQKIAECLCSIILLEDSTPRQVFNEFLLARTTAVQQLFHPNQTEGVKDQVCTVVKLITTTIHQIHSVFYQGDSSAMGVSSNLLVTILTTVTSQKQHESGLLDFHQSSSLKSLPSSVLDFCPTLRSHATPVSVQYLQDNCQQWIDTCIRDVKHGVGKLLGFVNTVKRLADIRDAVWELLSQDDSMTDWQGVCSRILNRKLSSWEDFLWALFLDRVKALMKYQLDTATELTKRQVSKLVMEIGSIEDGSSELEVDLSKFIWCEGSGDIQANMAWTTASARTSSEQAPSGLLMKAKAYTPVIQSLCHNYDDKLLTLIEDCKHYIQPADDKDTQTDKPFNRYGDTADLLNHLKVTCHRCVEELLTYVDEQLELWKLSLEIPDRTTNQITINKILLVGRFCGALAELAPSLKHCIVGQTSQDKLDLLKSQMKSSKQGSKVVDDPVWLQVKERLAQCHRGAYRIWVEYLSASVLKDFKACINNPQGKDAISTCTRWDEVSIQEETESGKNVSSKIRIPMQASWYIQDLLFSLCREINRVGAHTIHRKVVEDLVVNVSNGILTGYEEILNACRKKKTGNYLSMSQQMALQLLYDVKFVVRIIPRKDDQQESKLYQQRSRRVIERLEEKIDPFDLDVFSPYIQSHLTKQTQRLTVLYGALTSLDKLGMFSTGRGLQTTHQEQHNVLPLTTCQNRFILLPLSTQPSNPTMPSPILSQSLHRSVMAGGDSLTEKAAAVLPQPSSSSDMTSSFYNKLGSMSELSSWFSNIGGSTK
ncbi:conserved oligomeric Golgi complex subunit 1-like [Pecten maximus]|uniref:conserved oligomeric Golgi complex subunit 1-like n=1 Tax=Pecten maximus TaxID=6579 RepID=UPI001458A4B6|nr:conserved oligomeric Golgi complex subunit 1-like [Pecten maximus]